MLLNFTVSSRFIHRGEPPRELVREMERRGLSKKAYEREATLDGGRDRDRTCDPLDVNEVLSR
jgi:hypothetical protein